MPTQILMPALSPTMEEGKLAKWLIKEGDAVKSGMVIAEIETDKATMAVEAVDEGKVERILVAAGTEGVKVNTPIAIIRNDAEAPAQRTNSGGAKAPPAASKTAAAQPQPAPASIMPPTPAPSPTPVPPDATVPTGT